MATVKSGFDASNATRQLGRVFGEYLQWNQRSSGELLHQLGAKLSVDLYMQCAGLREEQQRKIEALPATLEYHIKRRLSKDVGSQATAFATFKRGKHKGSFKSQSVASQVRRASTATHVSVADEIRLRKRFAAIYQASGWLSDLVKGVRASLARLNPPAVVVETLNGTDMRITISNPRKNSAEFAESSGYLAAAFQYRINEMRTYIQRKISGDVQEFNRPRPNFGSKDARTAVAQAMQGQLVG